MSIREDFSIGSLAYPPFSAIASASNWNGRADYDLDQPGDEREHRNDDDDPDWAHQSTPKAGDDQQSKAAARASSCAD
jgi:hypothetical protein